MIKTKEKGFTLIELMIVVAVIGILAAISLPSYINYVERSRRVDAQTDVVVLAGFMERYYTQNFSYLDAAGNAPALPFSNNGGDIIYYTYALDPAQMSATTFRVVASPQGGQANDKCGSLSLTHDGTAVGYKGSSEVADCW